METASFIILEAIESFEYSTRVKYDKIISIAYLSSFPSSNEIEDGDDTFSLSLMFDGPQRSNVLILVVVVVAPAVVTVSRDGLVSISISINDDDSSTKSKSIVSFILLYVVFISHYS